MPLYLYCALCGRKQADGLLSRGYWGHVDLVDGTVRQACPTCKEQHTDWEARLHAVARGEDPSGFGSAYGTSYGIAG